MPDSASARATWRAAWLVLAMVVARPPMAATPQPEAPVLIGQHAGAVVQPRSIGKIIATLEPFGRRLYVGYGDYSADSGPIDVVAVNLDTGQLEPPRLSFASEAIYLYRQIGGRLFAPDIDPRQTRLGGYAMGEPSADGDVWTDHKPVRATHIFDVATFDGSDLWLFGSLGANAVAWRSTDRGTTWTSALTASPRADDRFARFYSGFVLDGRLYTQAADFPGGLHPTSMVFDGETWQEGPRLIPAVMAHQDLFPWRPLRVGDKVVYMDDHGGTTSVVARLYRFDGVRAEVAFGRSDVHQSDDPRDFMLDLAVGGDTAYALNRLQQVWSSSDLVDWTLETTVQLDRSERATAIAVVDGDLYCGTNFSRIYRLRLGSR